MITHGRLRQELTDSEACSLQHFASMRCNGVWVRCNTRACASRGRAHHMQIITQSLATARRRRTPSSGVDRQKGRTRSNESIAYRHLRSREPGDRHRGQRAGAVNVCLAQPSRAPW